MMNVHSIIYHSSLIIHLYHVVPGRLELPTPTLSVLYSNQLSYETEFSLTLPFTLTSETEQILQIISLPTKINFSIRRYSSRTFRYGYLVTT